jgi:uncharacterized cupredoxin-like copper-binding protein
MRRRFALIAFVMAIGTAPALLSGCGGKSEQPHADADLSRATSAQTVAVEMRDIAFAPARFEIAVDQIVDIDLRNAGQLDHDFTIERMAADALVIDSLVVGTQTAEHQGHGPSFAVHGAPGPGKGLIIRLHPHTKGEFTFYCTVPGHREAGMTGKLVVG